MNWRAILRSSRPSFLILTPICVWLGVSAQLAQGHQPSSLAVLLVLLGAISAHISVNTFNEYFDFRSGLDLLTAKTPFSGGSGSLPEAPTASNQVLGTAVVALLITVSIGVYFSIQVGPTILPLGLAGVILVVAYTQWVNRHPWLCLIAPGTGFGILMVAGTQLALGGTLTATGWTVALLPFLLTNNLLLLNQYPDIDADIRVGRRHFPISYGISAGNRAYLVFLSLAGILVIGATAAGWLPLLALMALLPLPLAIFAWHGANRHRAEIAHYPKYLAANVIVALLSPALLALGLNLGT